MLRCDLLTTSDVRRSGTVETGMVFRMYVYISYYIKCPWNPGPRLAARCCRCWRNGKIQKQHQLRSEKKFTLWLVPLPFEWINVAGRCRFSFFNFPPLAERPDLIWLQTTHRYDAIIPFSSTRARLGCLPRLASPRLHLNYIEWLSVYDCHSRSALVKLRRLCFPNIMFRALLNRKTKNIKYEHKIW